MGTINLEENRFMIVSDTNKRKRYEFLEEIENNYDDELPDFDFEEIVSNQSIVSLLQGKINEVKVKVGDKVKNNEILAIQESMKMEIDIRANCDGTIQSSNIKNGDFVKTNQELFIITMSE